MAQAVAAHIQLLPIELYFGQAPSDTLRLLSAWNMSGCPVALDVEAGSFPSEAWQLQWQQSVDGAGYQSVGYSQAAASVPFRRRWKAQYTWPGQPDQRSLLPVQPVPAGYDAVQYAHDFAVSSFTMDASNFNFEVGDMTPDEMQQRLDAIATGAGQTGFGDTIRAILSTTQQVYNAVAADSAAVAAVKAELDVVKAELEAGGSLPASAAIARIEKALQSA